MPWKQPARLLSQLILYIIGAQPICTQDIRTVLTGPACKLCKCSLQSCCKHSVRVACRHRCRQQRGAASSAPSCWLSFIWSFPRFHTLLCPFCCSPSANSLLGRLTCHLAVLHPLGCGFGTMLIYHHKRPNVCEPQFLVCCA